MSVRENKELVRRYIQAIDDNQTSDWSVLDEYIAEDFVAHNPAIPGVSLDRDGRKQAAEILRVATPGRHEIPMQIAEGATAGSSSTGRSPTSLGFCSRSEPCPDRPRAPVDGYADLREPAAVRWRGRFAPAFALPSAEPRCW